VKQKFNLAAIMLIVAIIMIVDAPLVVSAGDAVMDRKVVTLSTSAGTATWTQNVETANIELKRIAIVGGLYAADTITVSRVTGETKAATNVLGALVLVSGEIGTNLVATAPGYPVYMKRGDKLTFASGSSTGATANIEYLIQSR
jgi:hypothetical protein